MSMEDAIKMHIGKMYCESTVLAGENGDFVKNAFREIVKVNNELFAKIPFPVIFTEDDCYQSAKEMRERVMKEKVIYIYTGTSGHPFLNDEENNIGRTVHDVFAHLVCGCPFTFQGEYNAYLTQREYYPRNTWEVLFCEIPCQTAAYYYKGSFDYKQRAFIPSVEWMELCSMYLVHDYSKNSVLASPFQRELAIV